MLWIYSTNALEAILILLCEALRNALDVFEMLWWNTLEGFGRCFKGLCNAFIDALDVFGMLWEIL